MQRTVKKTLDWRIGFQARDGVNGGGPVTQPGVTTEDGLTKFCFAVPCLDSVAWDGLKQGGVTTLSSSLMLIPSLMAKIGYFWRKTEIPGMLLRISLYIIV